MINMELAKQRGISQDNIEAINSLHELLEKLIQSYTLEVDYQEARDLVRSAEFQLQKLWSFPEDERYHSWVDMLADKHLELQWAGKTFECQSTGERRTLTKNDTHERNFIAIGACNIDMGVAGGYHRVLGNLKEIV